MKEETLKRVEQYIGNTFKKGRTCDDHEIAEALEMDIWDVTETTTYLEAAGRIKAAINKARATPL
ncbi:MAG: hypothetical protein ACFFCW_44495 [Candidatus Hodarchaeota archaeon]